MRKFLNRHRLCYRILLIVAYLLPFALLIAGVGEPVASLLLESFILALFFFAPYLGCYYAVLTFCHTLIYEVWIAASPKGVRIAMILIAFACSAFWAVSSIFAGIAMYQDGVSNLVYDCMLGGFVATTIFQVVRLYCNYMHSNEGCLC